MEEAKRERRKAILGQDEATIDGKGRLLLAKKKRERLGDGFVIALGEIGCLCAYPAEVWEEMLDTIYAYESINLGRQMYSRMVLGTAEDELSCDEQGRVVIPAKLRKMAALDKDVVLVGCGDRLEIWDREEYAKYEASPATYGQQRRETLQQALDTMKGR
ncbi:cell division/cell wall cluster transcriptional repressor MraZ [bacterium]|nr:MAG: cell division/cell wall cluster transcriptional repressor MraZ [bacterium]